MGNLYKHPEWIKFRDHIIDLDDGQCVRCGKQQSDRVILQVHHTYYESHRLPWEYPHEACETLCKRCHAAEHDITLPVHGWGFMGYEDLGDLSGSCEFCETQIRHVYYLHHQKWAPIGVGTDCCDRLTGNKKGSSFTRRRKNFCKSPRWKSDGNIEYIRKGKYKIEIISVGDKYEISVISLKCEDRISGKDTYPTSNHAKSRIFQIMDEKKIDALFMKHFGRC
ncbi:HNH endonuclease [Desulfatibacillum alkenivorans DSM 16219]|jgi:hypothetical protein|uniref:HNH endonuclease n=1 Tax=Desulfatibacillum alkenivorans DSM 16219 TaxID=1121393 RepID=A0A1M6UL13_9BACT|nr:HNH endonuclease [Desulfatibacillum alkenivorans]SHK69859.1 HNH endonuclease [Desulfatibacillum alkenivorans DSM 16219]